MIRIGDVLVLSNHDTEDFLYLVVNFEWSEKNSCMNIRLVQLCDDIKYMKTMFSSPLSYFELMIRKPVQDESSSYWSIISSG